MPWKIELESSLDLPSISKLFPNPPLKIQCGSGQWFLEADSISQVTDTHLLSEEPAGIEDFEAIHSLIDRVNGWLVTLTENLQTIRWTGLVVRPNGKQLKMNAFGGSRLTGIATVEARTGGSQLVFSENENVREILRLLGSGSLDFYNLYKVFELIRKGRKSLTENSKSEHFKRSANDGSPVSRHAVPTSDKPPKKEAMTVEEAQTFIRGLALEYLQPLVKIAT
jgi:hypothetical protein